MFNINVGNRGAPTPFDQHVAQMEERQRSGTPFNANLLKDLSAQKQEYARLISELSRALLQQMEDIEILFNGFCREIEDNDNDPSDILTPEVENLKTMAEALSSNQKEMRKALEGSRMKLSSEENENLWLIKKEEQLQKKLDGMQKNPYAATMNLGSQRIAYRTATGQCPPNNFKGI